MPVFLGVDGGGSKTHALLIDEAGSVFGFGQAGTGNHQSHGLKAALAQISKSVRLALSAARLGPEQVELGCFCLAGADLPQDYAMLQPAVEGLGLACQVVIKNDTMAALRSGLTRSWGVVVICGTGFNAAGRGRDGREIVLPGLGPISGDWGGGGQLVEEMIRAVMRAWDGRGEPTRLTPVVLNALGYSSTQELLTALYQRQVPRARILALTPLLFETAEAGDRVSRGLLVQMGTEIAVTANALLRRLDLTGTDSEVVFGGSVFKGKSPLLIETASDLIHAVAPHARIVRPKLEPVGGAALMALDLAGIEAGQQTVDRMVATMPAVRLKK